MAYGTKDEAKERVHCIEDAEGLLNLLLLVDALVLSFVIPTIVFFDKTTLKAADVLSCKAYDEANGAGSCDDASAFAWGGAHHVFPNPRSYTLVSVSYMAYMPVIRLQI